METINGYSINDKSRLQAEIEQFRKKRNTALAVGITLTVIAIMGIIIVAVIMGYQAYEIASDARNSGHPISAEEAMGQLYGLVALMYLFGFMEPVGNVIALAGGISNHVKMKNRMNTLQRLKNIEPAIEQ